MIFELYAGGVPREDIECMTMAEGNASFFFLEDLQSGAKLDCDF